VSAGLIIGAQSLKTGQPHANHLADDKAHELTAFDQPSHGFATNTQPPRRNAAVD
jgi:hypothetical protein